MDRAEIHHRLESVMAKVFGSPVKVTNKTTARDVEDRDSLTHVQLIVALEADFGMKFTTPEIVGLKNVGDMIDLIHRKSQAKS